MTNPTRALLDTLELQGVPKKQIAQALLIQPSAVTDLYAGKRQLKYDEGIQLVAKFMRSEFPVAAQLPVIGMAGAGNWVEAIEQPDSTVIVPDSIGAPGKFVVQVSGESMNQVLPNGSYAIVDPEDKAVYVGQIYLLQNEYGEGTIKRFRADPSRFEPVSSDPSFEPILIGSVDFQVIGRVTGMMQKF